MKNTASGHNPDEILSISDDDLMAVTGGGEESLPPTEEHLHVPVPPLVQNTEQTAVTDNVVANSMWRWAVHRVS